MKHPSHASTQKPSQIPTAYLATPTVALAFWISSSHAAAGAPSSAPGSTCMGSPQPSTFWKARLCPSTSSFSCQQTALLSVPDYLSKLP